MPNNLDSSALYELIRPFLAKTLDEARAMEVGIFGRELTQAEVDHINAMFGYDEDAEYKDEDN